VLFQFHATRTLLLSLLLAPIFSAGAIGIDPVSTASPSPNEKDASSILKSLSSGTSSNGKTPEKILSSGADNRGTGSSSSLTSSGLAVGEDSKLSEVGSMSLNPENNKAVSPRLYPDDSRFTVTIEGLAISEGFVMPDRSTLIAAGASAAVATMAALYFRHHWRCNGRRMRFGVLWNGYRKPLCMKCNSTLHVLNDYSFQCPSCRVELGAYGDNGRTISPHEALERIRLKQYWSPN
jgi:hypothetical protein